MRHTHTDIHSQRRPHGSTGRRPPTKRIGEVLVELGYATQEQIDAALNNTESSLRLGDRLLQAKIIDDVQLAHALGLRFGVSFTDLSHISEVDPSAVSTVPERIARRYVLIPLSLKEGKLTVAIGNPGNVFALDTVRSVTGLDVEVVAAPDPEIRKAINRHYGFGMDLQSSATEMASLEIQDRSREDESELDISQIRTEADDEPVVKYVDSLVVHAIRDRASDIHIEPGRDSVSVRLRVDGKLRPTIAPPKALQNAVISRIKILASLDIAEKRLPLDGRLRVKLEGNEVDLRVSTLPTIHGEKVVLRILDKTALRLSLDKIGGDEDFLKHLEQMLRRPNGMILVTGPTGSGKSTTLYACLTYAHDTTKNVVSVEDPVEYEISGVTQVAARPDIGMSFARALRAILRQDPDVVMVGEMRDLETLEIGIRASLTGHLVLSTLHTNDAVSTITRMVNMGAEPYLIASTLLTTVAQRLVRCICPECKKERPATPEERIALEKRLGIDPPSVLWQGSGCSYCGKTGYYGRSAVFEYFQLDAEAREMVTRREPEAALRAHHRNNSCCLLEASLRKAAAGITTVEEAMQFHIEE